MVTYLRRFQGLAVLLLLPCRVRTEAERRVVEFMEQKDNPVFNHDPVSESLDTSVFGLVSQDGRLDCKPGTSKTSACLWTGDCSVGGCASKCIVNGGLTSSWDVLLDREVELDSYQACPLLSFWVNKMVAYVNEDSRRRLQSHSCPSIGIDSRAGPTPCSTSCSPTRDLLHSMQGNCCMWPCSRCGSVQDSSDMLNSSIVRSHERADLIQQKTASISSSGDAIPANTPVRRHLLDLATDAPAPGANDELPTNACPTAADIDAVKFLLLDAAVLLRQVFEINSQGQEMPTDLVRLAWALEYPNRYQFLVKMLENSDATAEYITNNCVDAVVRGPGSLLLIGYLETDQIALINVTSGGQMLQCVDNFDALDDSTRDLAVVLQTCRPPFDLVPDCFSSSGYHMITTTECAQSYARMFNVSVTNLSNIANTVDAIQNACTQVATEAECLSSQTPALAEIDSYHDSIPVRNMLNVSKDPADISLEELAPVPAACLTPPCGSPPPSRVSPPDDATVPADVPTMDEPDSQSAPASLPALPAQDSDTPDAPPAQASGLDSQVRDSDDSGGKGVNIAAAAGGAAAGAVLLCMLTAALVSYRFKRKRAAKLQVPTQGGIGIYTDISGGGTSGRTGGSRGILNYSAQGPHQIDTHGAKPGAAASSAQGANVPHGVLGQPFGHSSGRVQAWMAGRPSSYDARELRITMATTITTGADWSDFRRAANVAQSPLDELEVALDAMCCMATPFCGRYQVHSSVQRRVGGQGIVQFATITNADDKVAIKFYMDKAAFQRERDLYREPALKSMMPATLAVEENTSGEHATPYGYSFPPFVIIERGQSLDEWAEDNGNMDFATIYQALSHSVRALAKLHGTGYAHRDIKPGNILRRPKQHDWTLIDFGCAAQMGTTAGLAFSLKYAPPEVMQAQESGCRTIHVDAAVDIWAIGVIAFELLTSERAFPFEGLSAAEAKKAAQDAIMGRTPLLWEEASEAGHRRLAKMRVLRRTVMQCLERDPSLRPTSEELLESWDHMFDDLQTTQTHGQRGARLRS